MLATRRCPFRHVINSTACVVDIKFYLLHWRHGLETHASTSSRSQGQASRHDRPPSDGCPTRGAREPLQAGDCAIAAGSGDAVGKALCVARATAVARGRRRYCGPGRRSSGRGAVDRRRAVVVSGLIVFTFYPRPSWSGSGEAGGFRPAVWSPDVHLALVQDRATDSRGESRGADGAEPDLLAQTELAGVVSASSGKANWKSWLKQ